MSDPQDIADRALENLQRIERLNERARLTSKIKLVKILTVTIYGLIIGAALIYLIYSSWLGL